MLGIKKIKLKSITQSLVITTLIGSLVGCGMFRNREDDYLRSDIRQSQGLKVPKSLDQSTALNPSLNVPDGVNNYPSIHDESSDLLPPGYKKEYPLMLLKNLQTQSADSSLTFVKNDYGLLIIDAPLNKAYGIVLKELTSIPDFSILRQSSTGHSFEVVTNDQSKKYWLYLTFKDNKTRLSVFNSDKQLVADNQAYVLLAQLSSRIQALYQNGDSEIKVQYPIEKLNLPSQAITFKVEAPMPESMAFFKKVLDDAGYDVNDVNNKSIINVSMSNVKDQSFEIETSQNNDYAASYITIRPIEVSDETRQTLATLSEAILNQATKTFLSKKVSVLSVSSQIFIDPRTNKIALIVPVEKETVWDHIRRSIQQSQYRIVRMDQDKGFFLIASNNQQDHQYLVYARKVKAKSTSSLDHWLTLSHINVNEGSKTYVQVFDKNGHVMSVGQSKALLLLLQNNL